jgi:Domain of unknown function (DUF4123)
LDAERRETADIGIAEFADGYAGSAGFSPDLRLTAIKDIAPLDAQVGVEHKLTCPVRLHDLLFGNLPGLDPIGQAGLMTYAVLDAAKVMDLPERLARSGLEHRCLFTGKATEDLGAVAPWLVRLDPAHGLTRQLFTAGKASWQLSGKDTAIFLRSLAGIDIVHRHLRKFTRIASEETGRWNLFRFYDPVTLRALMAAGNMGVLERLAGDAVMLGCQSRDGRGFVALTRSEAMPVGASAPTAPVRLEHVLGPANRQALLDERVALYEKAAQADLQRQFPAQLSLLQKQDVQAVIRFAFAHARQRGITSHRDMYRYLMVVMQWGSYFELDPQYRAALQNTWWFDRNLKRTNSTYTAGVLAEVARVQAACLSDLNDVRHIPVYFQRLYQKDSGRPPVLGELLIALQHCWPAKVGSLEAEHLHAFARHAMAIAADHALQGADAIVYGCLAMYFGVRFADDPRFPWAKDALAKDARSDTERRIALGKGVLKYWDALRQGGAA